MHIYMYMCICVSMFLYCLNTLCPAGHHRNCFVPTVHLGTNNIR